MKALTIRQPWPFAILHLGKDVENRVWRTHYCGPLLIHAASHHENQPRELLAENMSRPPSAETLRELALGCIVGIAEIFDCVQNAKSRWADRGAWHWRLRNVRLIRPVEWHRPVGATDTFGSSSEKAA
jgi:hypothetical protein